MDLARGVARRATCDRKHVGALIALDNRIVSTGYNGSPPGLPHCDDVGHELVQVGDRLSCQRTIHAESNALLAAARFGLAVQGATMYVTAQPCATCAKAIVAAGLARVVWSDLYEGQSGVGLLEQAGVQITRL